MDSLAVEAVDHLKSEIASLLAGVVLPSLKTTVSVAPARVAPVGLGGFVRPHLDPIGDVVGRSVEATVLVSLEMPTISGLGTAVDAVSLALLTVDRKTQVERGFQRLTLASVGAVSVRPDGNDTVAERELNFSVHFEYLKEPEEAGGVIAEIPMTLEVE